MSEPIGIIAGDGMLPVMVARGIRAEGGRAVAAGMAGQYRDDFPAECDEFVRVGVLRVGEWARKLRRRGVKRAIMVGGVDKASLMFMPFWKRVLVMRPDWTVAKLWYRILRHDKRSQTLLTAVAEELRKAGIELMDSTHYIPEHLADAGVMTTHPPTKTQQEDIAFGWPILMNMNDLEIGQAIAVRSHDVVAVEAIEGTDAMIKRAGDLVGSRSKKEDGGWTLLKGAGPQKDLRFDVPTIGMQTIENLKAAGAGCLAVDAGRVIFVDKEDVLKAADDAGIAIVGVDSEDQSTNIEDASR